MYKYLIIVLILVFGSCQEQARYTNEENGVINTYGVLIKDEIIDYSDGQRYEEDIIYRLSDDYSSEPLRLRWIRFSIENNIVIKISYIITWWNR
jgi:hypothetical protein